jgi:hypothetical protein
LSSRQCTIDEDGELSAGGVVYINDFEELAHPWDLCRDVNKALCRVGSVGLHVTPELEVQCAVGIERHQVLPIAALPVAEKYLPRGWEAREAESELDRKVDGAYVHRGYVDEAGLADLDKPVVLFESKSNVGVLDGGCSTRIGRDVVQGSDKWPVAEKIRCFHIFVS